MRALGRSGCLTAVIYSASRASLGLVIPVRIGPFGRRPESILGFRAVRAAAGVVDRVVFHIMISVAVRPYERINPPGKDCRKNKSILHSLSPSSLVSRTLLKRSPN